MEEVEMDEESEKMSTKNRRSSILKMPKNRNPFGEVELPESCPETPLSKTTRRVSFASSNLVKPFVADPDKNTIWDTTYEEEVNHTDSTQSSQEQSNKINSTLFHSVKSSINITNVSMIEMDITKGVLSIDKENIPQLPRISIVDYAKKLSTSSVVPLYSLPSHNESFFPLETMELTCQDLNPCVVANDVSEMELTEVSIGYSEETNKSFYGAIDKSLASEMEFTCQIPVPLKTALCEDNEMTNCSNDKLSIPEKTFVNGTSQDIEVSKTDMEFTCQIPWQVSDKFSKTEKSFGNEMEFTNGPSVEAPKTEFTCQIPTPNMEMVQNKVSKAEKSTTSDISCQFLKKCQNNEISKSQKSICCDMEFTCQIPTIYQSVEASKTENSVGMEFTCQIPPPNLEMIQKLSKTEKSTTCDMEFTCQLPPSSLLPKCQSNEVSKSEKTISCDMEFTCQIPPADLGKMEKSFTKDMELTCQLPPVCQIKELSKPVKSVDCDTEFTYQTSASNLGKVYDPMSRTDKSIVCDMEFTCQLPTNCQSNELSKSQKTSCDMDFGKVSFHNTSKLEKNVKFSRQFPRVCQNKSKPEKSVDCDMEFTCQTPSSNFRKVYDLMSKTDKSIVCDTEFTCQSPEKSQSNELSKSQKTSCDMDFDKVSHNTSNLEKNVEFSRQFSPVCQKKVSKPEKSVDCDLEFTCQTPSSNLGKVYDKISKTDKSVVCDTEFTSRSPSKSQSNELSKSQKTVSCDMGLDKDCHNMTKLENDKEFNCRFPPVCQIKEVSRPEKSVDCDIEFTCQIPTSNLGKCDDRMPKTDADVEFDCRMSKGEPVVIFPNESVCQIPQSHELLKTKDTDYGRLISFTSQAAIMKKSPSCQTPNVNVDSCQMSKLDHARKQSELGKISLVSDQIEAQKSPINSLEVSKMVAAVKSPFKPSKTLIRSPTTPNSFVNKEESGLDLTCTSPINEAYKSKSILYSQKIPPNLKLLHSKYNNSDLKTPEPSFHINYTNISSGVDDTQHLLHCTYTKPLPECLLASRSETQECICACSKEIGDVTEPKLSNISQYDLREMEIDDVRNFSSSEDTIVIDVKRSKLATVNDTYVLAGKNALKNKTIESVGESNFRHANTYTIDNDAIEDKDTSLGFLDEDQLVLSDIVLDAEEMEDKDVNLLRLGQLADIPVEEKRGTLYLSENKPEVKLKEFNFTIKRVGELSDLIEKIEKRRKETTKFLENFRLREIEVPEEFVIPENSSSEESELSVEKSTKSVEDICPTIRDKIRERHESSHNTWQLEEVEDEFYHFSTLFGTLIFVVELDLESGRIRSMKTKTNLEDDTHPIGLYIMKLFLEKLDDGHIQAAIGDQFDVLSLLDYIQMTMDRLLTLRQDLINCSDLTLTREYIAKFRIIRVPLTFICEISLDVSDLENLNFDEIKICVEKGTLNEKDFRGFVKTCPKGYNFFKEFARCIDDYLKMKDKRKKFGKRHL